MWDNYGQRIIKTVKDKTFLATPDDALTKYYYIRDAQGNIMAVYKLDYPSPFVASPYPGTNLERGLVFKAEDYRYSSAIDYSGEKGRLNGITFIRLIPNKHNACYMFKEQYFLIAKSFIKL